MHRTIRRLAIISVAALPLTLAAVAAQTPPALFVGTVRDANGGPLANARIAGRVGGEICGESTAQSDGSYGLKIPDAPSRPSACSAGGAAVAISVNGAPAATANAGAPGAPVLLDLRGNASSTPAPTPPPMPSLQGTPTLMFNGTPTAGANSVAVVGATTTAQQLTTDAEAKSGKRVVAIWRFGDGQWRAYVPNLVEQFSAVAPPAALFIVLE